MKKLIKIAMLFVAFFISSNLVMAQNAPEERQGTVLSVNQDGRTGTLRDNISGEVLEFRGGAVTNIKIGDDVIFISVATRGPIAITIAVNTTVAG